MNEAIWNRYLILINKYMPQVPGFAVSVPASTLNAARSAVSRSNDFVGAVVEGLNVQGNLPPALGAMVAVASADSLPVAAQAGFENAASFGVGQFAAGGSGVTAGLIMLLKGGHRSARQSLQSREFLVGSYGFLRSLANYCIDTVSSGSQSALNTSGYEYRYEAARDLLMTNMRDRSSRDLGMYRTAGMKVGLALDMLDQSFPRDASGMKASALCMGHTVMLYGETHQFGSSYYRLRFEEWLLEHILGHTMQSLRRALSSGG